MPILDTLHDTFAESFMKPRAYRGRDIEEAVIESGLDYEEDGIYCRLSADGYMDCTDWYGPFESMEEAAQCLIDIYGD